MGDARARRRGLAARGRPGGRSPARFPPPAARGSRHRAADAHHPPPALAPVSELRTVHRSRSRSEEHTSELQSLTNLVCRLLLEKKKKKKKEKHNQTYNNSNNSIN